MQGIAILANECPESSAGSSKKRVRRAMLIAHARHAIVSQEASSKSEADWFDTNR